jgi:hypothetical protein
MFYSGKSKQHSVKYEIGVNIVHGYVCWIAGAVPGSVHDITLSRTLGIVANSHLLQPNEKVLGDKGYVGEPEVILTPIKNPVDHFEVGWNSFVNSFREIVEHAIARLKIFRCVSTKWRHDIELHPVIFYLVSQIVNIDLCFHPIHK